jgi:cobalt-precorrin 5A hydrolase
VITVGVGATSGVTAEEVLAAIDAVLPAGRTDVQLSTLTRRALEPGIAGAASARDWPLVGHDADELAAVAVIAPSSLVAAAVGTPSVAEAAALLGGGALVVGKTVLGRVTVAVAE